MISLRTRVKAWSRRLSDNSGVTLIELLAVVVILAVIAAVAVPTVLGQISKSKFNADLSTEQVIVDALQRAEFDYQSTGNTSSYLYLDPTTLGSSSNATEGYLLGSSNTANVVVPENATANYPAETVNSLLTNGYQNGTSTTTGRGFISSVNPPSSGNHWEITNNSSVATNNTIPSATFTYPVNSNGTTNTLYIYPAP